MVMRLDRAPVPAAGMCFASSKRSKEMRMMNLMLMVSLMTIEMASVFGQSSPMPVSKIMIDMNTEQVFEQTLLITVPHVIDSNPEVNIRMIGGNPRAFSLQNLENEWWFDSGDEGGVSGPYEIMPEDDEEELQDPDGTPLRLTVQSIMPEDDEEELQDPDGTPLRITIQSIMPEDDEEELQDPDGTPLMITIQSIMPEDDEEELQDPDGAQILITIQPIMPEDDEEELQDPDGLSVRPDVTIIINPSVKLINQPRL